MHDHNTFRNTFQNGTSQKLHTNSISDELAAGGKSLGCIGALCLMTQVFS